MAYRIKKDVGDTSRKGIAGGIFSKTKTYNLVKDLQFRDEFYELEPFEVTRVLLDLEDMPLRDGRPDYSYYGAVAGRFIINKNQFVKPQNGPQLVRPLDPRIKNYPIVGEAVIVGNYNGKSYYWGSLNNDNSVVDNHIQGISWVGTGIKPPAGLHLHGKHFVSNPTIRQVKAEEGDLIVHGRFGNSINLGHTRNKHDSSLIKIRSGQRTDLSKPLVDNPDNDKDIDYLNTMKLTYKEAKSPIPEDINKDKNSIYLSTHGKHTITNTNPKYDNKDLIAEGNCIILNSDSLVFNAREGKVNIRASGDVLIEAKGVNIHATSGNTIKMGDPRGVFMPTIDAMVMMEFMTEVMDVLNKGFAAIGKATNPPGLVSAAKDIATIVAKQIPRILEILTEQLFFNQSVMVQDPRFKIPEIPSIPEIPEIPKIPDLPEVPTLSEIPGVDAVELDKIEKLKGLKRS